MSTGIVWTLSILLLVLGVFLVVAVLMQQGKAHGLSGAIAGGAETFFGKEKGKRWDKVLSRATTVVGAVFVVAVLALYVLMPDAKWSTAHTQNNWQISPFQQTAVSQLQTVEDNETESK